MAPLPRGLALAALLLSVACAAPPAAPAPAPTAARSAPAAAAPAAPAPAAPAAAPTAAPAPVTVKFGALAAGTDAPFYMALARGYFQAQGIIPEEVRFQGADAMVAPLASGELHVGGGGPSAALFNAIARGVPVRVVADKGIMRPGIPYQSVAVRKELLDSGQFRDYADLRGRTLAATGTGATTHLLIAKALGEAGLGLNDANVVFVAFPDMVTGMANGSIDAGMLGEPFATRGEDLGVLGRWRSVGDFNPNHYLALLLYSPVFIKDQPDAARRFMVAWLQGVRDYEDAFTRNVDREAAIAILVEHMSLKDADLYRRMIPASIDVNGVVDRRKLEVDQEGFIAMGLVREPTNLNEVVDNQFAEAALAQLGRR